MARDYNEQIADLRTRLAAAETRAAEATAREGTLRVANELLRARVESGEALLDEARRHIFIVQPIDSRSLYERINAHLAPAKAAGQGGEVARGA